VNDERVIADRFDSAAHMLKRWRRESRCGSSEDAGSNDKCKKARHDVTPFALTDVCMESFRAFRRAVVAPGKRIRYA
jgi:hypothetical protein